MSGRFDQFIHFGNLGTTAQREALVAAIRQYLNSGGRERGDFDRVGLPLFTGAIQKTLDNPTMLDLCATDSSLTDQITAEILDHVQATQRAIRISENPIEEEITQLKIWSQAPRSKLQSTWRGTMPLLQEAYPNKEIDVAFYDKELKAALDAVGKANPSKNQATPESVRDHLTDKWQALLTKKDLAWQLDIIEQERARFVKDLYARIEELKKLKDALQPFTDQLGRLWDLSRSNLHRLDFDLLRQYAALLQRSEVLQQLAEMLGRLRKAETELEEETYRDIAFKTVWRVDHAQKSELVGIREGDDLGHLLPGETALLAAPELEMLFYKRFAEKRLQVYEFRGRALDVEEEEVELRRLKSKEDKKGPIIICVDTSGSMHGAPEQVAKVLCFALLKIALNEQRKCYLINFSTGIHTMDLTEFRNSLPLLLDFLGMSFHGGTDATPALAESLRMIQTEAYRKADVLMISDFVMDGLPKDIIARIHTAREAQTQFHSLVIGHSAHGGVVKEFDHNWHYDPQHPDSLKHVLKEIGGM